MRFAYRTKKGYVHNNPDKCNQDAYVLCPNLRNNTWEHYFGICDGHGPLGHYVSNYIKNNLPVHMAHTKVGQPESEERLTQIY